MSTIYVVMETDDDTPQPNTAFTSQQAALDRVHKLCGVSRVYSYYVEEVELVE